MSGDGRYVNSSSRATRGVVRLLSHVLVVMMLMVIGLRLCELLLPTWKLMLLLQPAALIGLRATMLFLW